MKNAVRTVGLILGIAGFVLGIIANVKLGYTWESRNEIIVVPTASPGSVTVSPPDPPPIIPGQIYLPRLPRKCFHDVDSGKYGIAMGTDGVLTIVCGGHHYAALGWRNTSREWQGIPDPTPTQQCDPSSPPGQCVITVPGTITEPALQIVHV